MSAKFKKCFCLTCEAEARHMYCFPGFVGGGGGINFFTFVEFLGLGQFLRNFKG